MIKISPDLVSEKWEDSRKRKFNITKFVVKSARKHEKHDNKWWRSEGYDLEIKSSASIPSPSLSDTEASLKLCVVRFEKDDQFQLDCYTVKGEQG